MLDRELVTAEQLARSPSPGPSELVAGRVVDVSPAGFLHGLVASRVLALLHDHVREHGGGHVTSSETGFLVHREPDTVRAPDAAFVSTASIRRWQAQPSTYFPGAPELAVEVLSPSDAWVEVEAKTREYLAAGGRVVWVLNPESQRVYVFSAEAETRVLTREDTLTGEAVLPGLSTPVKALFDWQSSS